MKTFGAKNVSQRGLSQQPGGVVSVLDVGDRHGCVGYAVVHNSVHGHRDRVLGQNLDEGQDISQQVFF